MHNQTLAINFNSTKNCSTINICTHVTMTAAVDGSIDQLQLFDQWPQDVVVYVNNETNNSFKAGDSIRLEFSHDTNVSYNNKNKTTANPYIKSIDSGSIPYSDNVGHLFQNWSNLQTICGTLFDNCVSTSIFEYSFDKCVKLETVPEQLFDACRGMIDAQYCFRYCSALSTVPQALFSLNKNLANVTRMFSYCNNLTVNVGFGSKNISKVSWFAHNTQARGIVHVVSPSITYDSFMADQSRYVDIVPL